MALTIYDFIQHVKQHGLQRPNRFEVQIALPYVLSDLGMEQSLSLMAVNVDVPGVNVSSVEMHVGTTRAIPYDKSTGDLNITFRCSGDMHERALFDTWIKYIFKSDHSVSYYDDIISNIQIKLLSVDDQEVYSLEINEAYPAIITDLNLDRQANDTLLEFQVTFRYRKVLVGEEFYDLTRTPIPFWPDGPLPNDVLIDPDMLPPGAIPNIFDVGGAINDVEKGIFGQINKIQQMADHAGILKGPANKLLNIVKGKVSRVAQDKSFPVTTKINNALDKVGFKKIEFPTINFKKLPFGG